MKYIIDTFKYLKSNLLLLVAYAVAAACVAAIIDVGAVNKIIESFTEGTSSAGITQWICLFLPVNTMSWWTVLFSLLAYIVLGLDLALICASADRHMRYNSLSPRGLLSSLNNNLMPCGFVLLGLVVLDCVLALLLAAIMKLSAASSVAYLFVLGLIICAALALVVFYVLTFFSLWLPCYTITGFRAFESMSYAYSLGGTRRRSIFLAIFLPVIVVAVCCIPTIIFANTAVAYIIVSLLCGALCVYIPVLCYVVYIDADGITREDLKKF